MRFSAMLRARAHRDGAGASVGSDRPHRGELPFRARVDLWVLRVCWSEAAYRGAA